MLSEKRSSKGQIEAFGRGDVVLDFTFSALANVVLVYDMVGSEKAGSHTPVNTLICP